MSLWFVYCIVNNCNIFFIFFNVQLMSVLRDHSFFSSTPQRPMTSDIEWFLYQILSIPLFSYLNSWERASIFPFECWVLNKGTTGTIFITSLVWRGPWLEIERGTSRTRSQHYTTWLSRRRYKDICLTGKKHTLIYTKNNICSNNYHFLKVVINCTWLLFDDHCKSD